MASEVSFKQVRRMLESAGYSLVRIASSHHISRDLEGRWSRSPFTREG